MACGPSGRLPLLEARLEPAISSLGGGALSIRPHELLRFIGRKVSIRFDSASAWHFAATALIDDVQAHGSGRCFEVHWRVFDSLPLPPTMACWHRAVAGATQGVDEHSGKSQHHNLMHKRDVPYALDSKCERIPHAPTPWRVDPAGIRFYSRRDSNPQSPP